MTTPQPSFPLSPSSDSRTWAMGAHLSALAGGFLGGLPAFVGPLVIWLLRREQDPYVAQHAREALNFNLSVVAYALAALALTVVTLGIGLLAVVPLGLLFAVLWLAVTVIATVRAANGEAYHYPLSIQFVKN